MRERNRARILDAARRLLAAEDPETFSMRNLAEEAGISVTTLYNLFGTRGEIIRALSLDLLEAFDRWVGKVRIDDPIERAQAEMDILVDLVLERTPPALVWTVLEDEHAVDELNAGWRSRDVLRLAIQEAMDRGLLEGDLDAAALAEHLRAVHVRLLRMWAAGVLDDEQFRAGVLHGLDVTLLAAARAPARHRLLRHAAALQPALRLPPHAEGEAEASHG